jgi:hypothetical protein
MDQKIIPRSQQFSGRPITGFSIVCLINSSGCMIVLFPALLTPARTVIAEIDALGIDGRLEAGHLDCRQAIVK